MSYFSAPSAIREANHMSASTKARIAIEKRIASCMVNELLDQGYFLSVDNGETETPYSNDAVSILKAMMLTDEDRLYVATSNGFESYAVVTWAYFVYGNDGWDVIADSGVSLDVLTPKTQALIAKLS